MPTRRQFLKAGAVSVAGLIASACAPAAPPAPTAAPSKPAAAPPTTGAVPATAAPAAARKPSGGIVVLRPSLGTERWLPHLGSGPEISALASICDFLLYADVKTRELVPGLAEKWEATPEKWTFHLRKGIQFHDGKGEFTARDVDFTLQTLMRSDNVNPTGPYLKGVLDKVDIPDPYTFVMYTKKPAFDLGFQFSLASNRVPIISKAYVDSVGLEEAVKRPIGTGPYKFVEHKNGNYLKLEAVENHWRQTSYYKDLTYRIVADQSTSLAMVQAGEADAFELPPELIAQAKGAGLGLVVLPETATGWVHLGGLMLPERPGYKKDVPWVLGDAPDRALKVRQALNFAVNRQQILDKIMVGQGKLVPVVPSFLEGQPWTDPAWKPYPYDVDRAKALLGEAGFPNGFEAEMRLVGGFRPEMPDLSAAVADFWEKIGVRCKRVTTDYASQRAAVSARNTAGVAWAYYLSIYDEPVLSMQTVGHSTEGLAALIEDKNVDKMVEQALQEMDAKKRTDIQRQMGQYLYDGYYSVPLTTKNTVFAVTKKIGKWPMIRGWSWPHFMEGITP